MLVGSVLPVSYEIQDDGTLTSKLPTSNRAEQMYENENAYKITGLKTQK